MSQKTDHVHCDVFSAILRMHFRHGIPSNSSSSNKIPKRVPPQLIASSSPDAAPHVSNIVMQAGFAMLEVGSVPAKHTKNLLVKV